MPTRSNSDRYRTCNAVLETREQAGCPMKGRWLNTAFMVSAIWCTAGYGVLVSRDFFRDFRPPMSVVVLLLIGVTGGILRLIVGRRHQGKLVFWCRRFGDTDELAGQLNRWHGRIIDEASRGLAIPVTLQDESVDTPPLVASAVVLPVFVAMLIGSIGSTLWIFDLPWFKTLPGKAASFVVAVLAVIAPSIVAVMVARRIGTRRVAPGGVARVVRRAVRGRRSHPGTLILRCATEHWQACVAELMDIAAMTIIDVSVPSTNVAWEVMTAAQRIGPRRVLFIQAESKVEDLVERVQENFGVLIRYDMSRAADELTAFSKAWRKDKHQLVDPDASLGPVGVTIARAVRSVVADAGSNPG